MDSNVAGEFVARISTPAVEMETAGLFETSLKTLTRIQRDVIRKNDT